ncbi:MAG: DNA topoisomerase IB [Flavobacteriales bacterium]|nr:DNA topoisomerase IB [Flavobacteriales bacterium]
MRISATDLLRDAERNARLVKLNHVKASQPGIVRLGKAPRFRYAKGGKPVRDEITLARIRSLAIPPAWTGVWICADAQGHLQATGFDVKGRKQYRYHPHWTQARGQVKFDHVLELAQRLPVLRAQLHQHLSLPGLPEEKVLAAVVRVMEHTHIRIGQESYARANGSYGLSTLKDRHLQRKGGGLRFVFRGKTGIAHDIALGSPRLSRIVQRCKALPGQDLFQYIDAEGRPRPITSGQVNAYIQRVTNAPFTSKDIRTWKGTVLAFQALAGVPAPTSASEGQRVVNEALDSVARGLGNTRSVCRKHYVHPRVLEAFLNGDLVGATQGLRARQRMDRNERGVLDLLRARARAPLKRAA